MIWRGGVVGHRGAGGRPPDRVKAASRREYTKRLKLLGAIADDPEVDADTRIKAVNEIGRYAYGKTTGEQENKGSRPVLLIEEMNLTIANEPINARP